MWSAVKSLVATISGRVKAPSLASRVTIIGLVVSEQDRDLLTGICREHQWDIHFTRTCRAATEAANRLKAPIILCDRDLPGTEWRDAVRALASSGGACVILLSKVLDDYLWNEVGHHGGHDVLSKPLQESDVVRAVKLAWSYWNSTVNLAQASGLHSSR
jgi:FixJ family two-component response regulator